MDRRQAFTGPYQYEDRSLAEYIRFRRVENRWRETPEFREMEMRWVHEGVGRLAAVVAGEVHVAAVPREVTGQAVARGMKTISGIGPGLDLYIMFGGLYFSNPDKLDLRVPWTKREVRKAMAMAINPDELNKSIFQGKGRRLLVCGFLPKVTPMNPRWEQRFDEMDGYNPSKAKQLLADSGYPGGFMVKLLAFQTFRNTPNSPPSPRR
jgi:peptide/nickel transport system substrate-binding protein